MLKKIFSLSVFCLSLVILPVMASEDKAENNVVIGAAYNKVNKNANRAAEYADTEQEGEATLKLLMANQSGDLNYKLDLEYLAKDDFRLKLNMYKGGWFKSTTIYNRFVHKLDTDYMENLQFREATDSLGLTPGGKFVTHNDSDPGFEYGITVEQLQQIFDMKLNTSVPTDLQIGLNVLQRKGHKQLLATTHCDNCHIESRAAGVDEMTTDVWAKVHAHLDKVDLAYKFAYSRFNNSADIMYNSYDIARHPVNGGSAVEFGPREIFDGSDEPIGYNNDNKSMSHTLKAQGNFNASSSFVANAMMAETTNSMMNIDLKTVSGAFRYTYKGLNGNLRTDVYLSTYKLDNDDYFVDLPNWREGRPGGGQDFDWTRMSAYNRTVSQLKARTVYKIDKNNRFTFTYRLKNVDREYEGTTFEDYMHEDGTTATSHLAAVNWDGRYGNIKMRAGVSYEMTSDPYANSHGILEDTHDGLIKLPDQGWIYYYQRIRFGEASNQPSADLNLNFNMSTRLTDKSFMNVMASYRDAENDEMNSYDWELESTALNVSLFAMISDKTSVSIGYDYNNMESAALFSTPIFDG